MNWNGVIGSVASVVNTALPLFFGGFAKKLGPGAIATAPIGPATLYMDGGVFKIGNFNVGRSGGASPGSPILLNFASPQGAAHTNLAVELGFGDAFDAEPWLTEFTYGDVTVGTSNQPAPTRAGNPLEGLWTYTTQAAVGVGDTVRAVVNPTLTLQLRLDASNNVVLMTAIGAVAALGVTYLLTARNNSGKEGTRSGTLGQTTAGKRVGDEQQFTLELPTGISYASGIFGLTLQLPIELSSSSVASDKRIKFETVSHEKRAAMHALRAV